MTESMHRDHVPNVDILNRCKTLSVESQLQGKRLRWLGHVFRMPYDRLPKKLLFGQVKGLRLPGRPMSGFNDVALHDCQACRIGRPYRDVQDRLLWTQDLSRTYLAYHELESVVVIIIVKHASSTTSSSSQYDLAVNVLLAGASYRLLCLICTVNVQLLCLSCLHSVGIVSGSADSVCKQN